MIINAHHVWSPCSFLVPTPSKVQLVGKFRVRNRRRISVLGPSWVSVVHGDCQVQPDAGAYLGGSYSGSPFWKWKKVNEKRKNTCKREFAEPSVKKYLICRYWYICPPFQITKYVPARWSRHKHASIATSGQHRDCGCCWQHLIAWAVHFCTDACTFSSDFAPTKTPANLQLPVVKSHAVRMTVPATVNKGPWPYAAYSTHSSDVMLRRAPKRSTIREKQPPPPVSSKLGGYIRAWWASSSRHTIYCYA